MLATRSDQGGSTMTHEGGHEGHDHHAGCGQACGMEGEACCGGHGHGDLFAFPTTAETVTVPAVQLAGLLDLVEKLCDDPRLLTQEADYLEAHRLLAEQAPQLVQLREEFLERMKTLLAEAQAPR